MTFSVVIPCYNCAKTLEATVKSVCSSGLIDYEILLIDDGSTDRTAELCDRLCAHDPTIRCIHQENAGVSAARNCGIREAQGDYLWFVDADDTVDAGSLVRAVEIAIHQHPDMLLFGMSFDYYHHGRMYRREALVPPCEGWLSLEQLKARFQEFYRCNALTPVWNKLYRRDLIMKHNVRFHEDMILMEDFLFVLELLPFCQNIYCLPEAIYHYRQSEDEAKIISRLKHIHDIDAFMQPFESSIQTLKSANVSGETTKFDAGDAVLESMYFLIMRQRVFMASIDEIRKVSAEYVDTCQKWSVSTWSENDRLFCDMEKQRAFSIFLWNRLSIIKRQIKERIAYYCSNRLCR